MWNRFGGVSVEELILNVDNAREFVRCASTIPGWNPVFHEECIEIGCLPDETNPVQISKFLPTEEPAQQTLVLTEAEPPLVCCMDCGRNVHNALQRRWQTNQIMLPPRVLNHLLNSIKEAIEFARGEGPNNWLVWKAAMEDATRLLADLDDLQTPSGLF